MSNAVFVHFAHHENGSTVDRSEVLSPNAQGRGIGLVDVYGKLVPFELIGSVELDECIDQLFLLLVGTKSIDRLTILVKLIEPIVGHGDEERFGRKKTRSEPGEGKGRPFSFPSNLSQCTNTPPRHVKGKLEGEERGKNALTFE